MKELDVNTEKKRWCTEWEKNGGIVINFQNVSCPYKGAVLAEKEKDTILLNDNKYFCLIVGKNGLIVMLVQCGIGYMTVQRNILKQKVFKGKLIGWSQVWFWI